MSYPGRSYPGNPHDDPIPMPMPYGGHPQHACGQVYQPGPYAQPYYGAPQPFRPAPSNGMGTAGFVCGLIGFLLSLIPLVGVIAWPLVIIGVVLSGLGMNQVHNGKASNNGLAIAGLTLAGLGLLICFLWASAVFG